MFSVYGKCEITFNNGVNPIDFPFVVDLSDYEDTFVVESEIAIDKIVRGWIGDVRIVLRGHKIDDTYHWNENAVDVIVYKDALCYRRTVNVSRDSPAIYKYMFMKY